MEILDAAPKPKINKDIPVDPNDISVNPELHRKILEIYKREDADRVEDEKAIFSYETLAEARNKVRELNQELGQDLAFVTLDIPIKENGEEVDRRGLPYLVMFDLPHLGQGFRKDLFKDIPETTE